MAASNIGFRMEEIAHQWLVLTERRLAYYQELYRSGRWTRYYPSREHFAARMLDVMRVVKTFRALSETTGMRTQAPAIHFRARNGRRTPA